MGSRGGREGEDSGVRDMVTERFSPSVLLPAIRTRYGTIPERTVTPEGWQWVLAFAVRGCSWAVEEASKPEFKERILRSLDAKRREAILGAIEAYLEEIRKLREELTVLDGRNPS